MRGRRSNEHVRDSQRSNERLFFSLTWEYLEVHMPGLSRSLETIKAHRDALSIFRRFLLDEKRISISVFSFSQCTPELVQDFVIYLKGKDNMGSSINRRISSLRTYLWFAADRDISLQSIALRIEKFPACSESVIEKEAMSEDAVGSIIRQASDTKMGLRDRTMMILLYDSAVRVSELIGLTIKDIVFDPELPYIKVHGKGRKERIVTIAPMTAGHIREYIRVFHSGVADKNAILFFTCIKGSIGMMSEGNVERFIKKYADQAREECRSIPKSVYPHMFRRTRATRLYQEGTELELLSRILGHAMTQTTKVYAKPSMQQMRAAMASSETPEQSAEKPLWKMCSEEEKAKLCGLR